MAEAITTVLTTNTTYENRATWGILGYYQTDGRVGSVECQSGSVYITNTDTTNLGACCHSTATGCAFGVSCDGPVIFWADGSSSSTCSETCRGRTVVGSATGYDPWTASSYVCMEEDDYRTDLGWTLEVPVTTTIIGSASYISSVKDAETSTATPAPPPSTVASATAPPESGNEDDAGDGTNVGAIVGGVVGGVAGLTLILAAVWFYMRRRKQKEGEMRELGAGYVPPTQDK